MLGIDFLQVLLHAFNVVILFFGLYILLYKPVRQYMEKREEYYANMKKDAENKLGEAEDLRKEYEDKLAGAHDEIVAQKRKASSEIEEARMLRIAEAEKEADRIITEAKEDAEKQRNAIISDVRYEISGMISDAAEKLLYESSNSDLYETFLNEVEGSGVGD